MRYEAEIRTAWPWNDRSRARSPEEVRFARTAGGAVVVVRADAENADVARSRILDVARILSGSQEQGHTLESDVAPIYDWDIVQNALRRWARERTLHDIAAAAGQALAPDHVAERIRAALREINVMLVDVERPQRTLGELPGCRALLEDELPRHFAPLAAASEAISHEFRLLRNVGERHPGDLTADEEMFVEQILLGALDAINTVTGATPRHDSAMRRPEWEGCEGEAAIALANHVEAISATVHECGVATRPKALVLASRGADTRRAKQLRTEARKQAAAMGNKLVTLAFGGLALLPPQWLPATRAGPLDLAITAFGVEGRRPGFARLDELTRAYCAASALLDCSLAMLDEVEHRLRQAGSALPVEPDPSQANAARN